MPTPRADHVMLEYKNKILVIGKFFFRKCVFIFICVFSYYNKTGNDFNIGGKLFKRRVAAIAPFCCPGFESQACHLSFFQFVLKL